MTSSNQFDKQQQPEVNSDDDSSDDSEYVPDEAELEDDDLDDDSPDDEADDDVADVAASANGDRRPIRKQTKKLKKRGKGSRTVEQSVSINRIRRGGIRLEGEVADKSPLVTSPQPQPPPASDVSQEDSKIDEREKRRADALWASFLSDVRPAASSASASASDAVAKATVAKADNSAKTGTISTCDESVAKKASTTTECPTSSSSREPVRTKIFDFAGESIAVPLASPSSSSAQTSSSASAAKRPAGAVGRGGGVTSLLDRLTKRPKLSTLEKSRLDWESFKSNEGIGEDLAAHNKGKAGYLERKAFLERADYRRYELERDARLASSRGPPAGGKS